MPPITQATLLLSSNKASLAKWLKWNKLCIAYLVIYLLWPFFLFSRLSEMSFHTKLSSYIQYLASRSFSSVTANRVTQLNHICTTDSCLSAVCKPFDEPSQYSWYVTDSCLPTFDLTFTSLNTGKQFCVSCFECWHDRTYLCNLKLKIVANISLQPAPRLAVKRRPGICWTAINMEMLLTGNFDWNAD